MSARLSVFAAFDFLETRLGAVVEHPLGQGDFRAKRRLEEVT